MNNKEPDITVRSLVPKEDMDAILDIEILSYEQPRTDLQLAKWIRRKNVACIVALSGLVVVGFAIVEIFRDHFHLLDLAVRPKYRRKGVGRELFIAISDQLAPSKRSRILIYLRESNLMAQLFLRGCGCRAVNILHRHYEDTKEDSYLMEYRLKWPAKLIKNDKKGQFAKH